MTYLERVWRAQRKMIPGTFGGRSRAATPQHLNPKRVEPSAGCVPTLTRLGNFNTNTGIGQAALTADGTTLARRLLNDVEYLNIPAFTSAGTDSAGDVGTMAYRSGVLYWTDTDTTADRPIYYGDPASPTHLVDITTAGGGSSSIAYSAANDRLYLFFSGSSITDVPELYEVHPTTGAHTLVASLQRFASPAPFPIVVTPDGAVWGFTYDYSGGAPYTGTNRTVWWRYDGSLTETVFPSGPQPVDEGFILIPQPDSTVLFVDWNGTNQGWRLAPDGTITAAPILDPTNIGGTDYTFDEIRAIGYTPDATTVLLGRRFSGGWFQLTSCP